jgi:hypothetical protein
MKVVIDSHTLDALLNKEQNSIEFQNAKVSADRALETAEEYAVFVWCDEDVRDHIKEAFEVDLSDEDVIGILRHMENCHDCCNGITWETIESLYQNYFEKKYPRRF